MTDIISFGEWVQKRRNQLRYTRKGLAELVVCSPVTIKKIERDERRPSPEIAALLAQHLQLPGSERENFMARARGEFVSNFISPTELSIEEAQALVTEVEAPRHNLPHQPTPFFGRTQELAEITGQLANPNCRLLTILGAGGMGKTRLSIEAARSQIENFTDGITFVELAPIDANRSEGEINPLASALADALGIGFHGESQPEQQLSDYLSRKEMLIVYDNFEHLLETAVFLSTLLSHAPDIKILITSRERLNLQEEWLYALQGLSMPASSDLQTSDAVQFFIERAKQVKTSFDESAELDEIQRICQLLAGMPLGIELSAPWVLQLSCRDIATEIEQELDFLTTEMRNIPERHRSIRAIWDYSWEKLTDKERSALKKLSVFRGGFERTAAKEVAGASLPILAKLVSKSLLSVEENGRYQIHELLRQFAAEKLESDSSQLKDVQSLHCHFYLAWLDGQATAPPGSNMTISNEIDNVRTAIKTALNHSLDLFTVPVLQALFAFYFAKGWIVEMEQITSAIAMALRPACIANQANKSTAVSQACIRWFSYQGLRGWIQARLGLGQEGEENIRQALQVLPEEDRTIWKERTWGLFALGWSLSAQGKEPSAQQAFEESIALANKTDEPQLERYALDGMVELLLRVGDFERAETMNAKSLELHSNLGLQGDTPTRAAGLIAQFRGEYTRSIQLLKRALELTQATHAAGHLLAHFTLGNLARLQGRMTEAGNYLQQGIRLANEFNLPKLAQRGRWYMGELAVAAGDYQTALDYFPQDELVLRFSTGGLGWAYLGLGNLDEARVAFEKSLQKMLINHTRPIGLHALVGMAYIKARSGQVSEALALLSLVIHHGSSTFEAKEKAQELFDELAAELPDVVVEEAVSQRKALDLFETAAALLSESK